jgi:ribonuclease HII
VFLAQIVRVEQDRQLRTVRAAAEAELVPAVVLHDLGDLEAATPSRFETGAHLDVGTGPHAPQPKQVLASARVPGPFPTLRHERKCWEAGDRVVVGIDEVGRGSWAGPVTVGAVVAPPEHLTGVKDSKLLTPAEREVCAARVRAWALGIGIGHASHEECDLLGMTAALRIAATRALAQLAAQGFEPDRIVLDGNHDYLRRGKAVHTVIKGDQTILSVAAASVVAKVTRDALMAEEAEHYPAYGFESNRGYPAPVHKCALAAYGPSSIHRRSWIFMDYMPWGGLSRFERVPRLFDLPG